VHILIRFQQWSVDDTLIKHSDKTCTYSVQVVEEKAVLLDIALMCCHGVLLHMTSRSPWVQSQEQRGELSSPPRWSLLDERWGVPRGRAGVVGNRL
jgi:hypothetical protein